MSLELNPRRTALVLLDFQHDIASPGGKLGPGDSSALGRFAVAVDQAARMLTAARAANLTVVHVATRFNPGHADANLRMPRAAQIRARNALVEGSSGAAFVNALEPADGEAVVVKRGIGAMACTNLDALLKGFGIDTLVLAGIGTHLGVEGTARHAADCGYGVHVLHNACASGLRADHFASLHVLASVADVTDVATAIAAIGQEEADDDVEILDDYEDLELIEAEDEKILRIFEMFDADGSGSIDHAEFADICRSLGGLIDGIDLGAAFEKVDVDGNGSIDFQEFLNWWRSRSA